MFEFFKSFLIGYSSSAFFTFGKIPFESDAVAQGEIVLNRVQKNLFFYKKRYDK
jgi:hypothetical protein